MSEPLARARHDRRPGITDHSHIDNAAEGAGYPIDQVVFCVFVVIGAAASLGPVIDFSDAAIFAMAVVNIAALYVLMPIVKKELNSYLSRLKSGEIKRFKG